MAERPILFSAPMVRAILEGRKTMTRRVLKPQPFYTRGELGCIDRAGAPQKWLPDLPGITPYAVGHRLWLKHSADIFDVYWKPITGWEGVYAAGTDGHVYRMDGAEPQRLKGTPSSKGYLTVSLSNGEWHTKLVHRLVCETFYGPAPFEGAQVRHLDGDQTNNHPSNLDWGSQGDNWRDRKAHGRGMGADHHSAKLSDTDVAEIRASSLSQRKLAAQFRVAQSTIWNIRKGLHRIDHVPASRNVDAFSLWRSPIHMPRWASRITLEVTAVRAERLQDISEEDAEAEGCDFFGDQTLAYKGKFAALWAEIHGPGAWGANPWVAAITFERV